MVSFNPAITEKLNNLSSELLSGHYIFSRDYEENALARRFSKPDLYPHNINFKISEDPKHIQQYHAVRGEAYKTLIGEDYYAGVDEYDDKSHKLLGIVGNNCIGGIRFNVSSPENPQFLPLENEGMNIKKLYKDIDFSDLTYCEASRLALLPEFRNGEHLAELFEKSSKFCLNELGVGIVFGRSGLLQTRKFQIHHRNMGYELIVRKNVIVPVPSLEHMKIQLWAIDFTPDRRYTPILKGYNERQQAGTIFDFA